MKTGVREIARRTGLSPATVSNALNHKRGTSRATIERVAAVARDLGYQHPDEDIRRFAPKLDRIALVTARATGKIVDTSRFRVALEEGVETQAKRHGLEPVFMSLDLSDRKAAKAHAQSLCKDRTTALVLLATEMEERDYRLFDACEAPLVIVDGWSSVRPFECVVTTNQISSYDAVSYLIRKHHDKIGYLAGSIRTKNYPLREEGYLRALSDAGLVADPRCRLETGSSLESAYAAVNDWVSGNPELPTAFFADNDILALGAMRAFAEHGIRVPEDVSLVGFDDLVFVAFSNPPLTTVRVPIHDMGELAVRKAVRQVRTPRNYKCITQVCTTFVERGTVRDLGR